MTIKNSIYRGLIALSTTVFPLTSCSNNQDNYQVSRSTSSSHEQKPQIQQVKQETARPTTLEYRFKDIPIPKIASSEKDIHKLYFILSEINPGILGREANRQLIDSTSGFNGSIFNNLYATPTEGEVGEILAAMLYKYCTNIQEWNQIAMDQMKAKNKGNISEERLNEILQIRYIDPVRLGLSNEDIVNIQTGAAADLMTVRGSGITGFPTDRDDIEKALNAFVARDDVPDTYFNQRQIPEWIADKDYDEKQAAKMKKIWDEHLASQNHKDESRNNEPSLEPEGSYQDFILHVPQEHQEESEPEPDFEPEWSRTRSGELKYSQDNIEGNSLLEWIVQEGGAPIEGAIVRMLIEKEEGSYEHQGTTNSDGRAIVELSRGDWKAAFLYKDRIRVRIGGRDYTTGNKVIPENHTITPSDLEQADPGETISDEIQVVDEGFMYGGQELGGRMLTLRVEVETTDDN